MQISKTGLFRQAVKLPLPGQLFFFVLFSGPSTALPCIDWERGGGISRPSERNGCCDETLSRFRQLRRVLSGLPVPAALLSAAHARHGGPNGSHPALRGSLAPSALPVPPGRRVTPVLRVRSAPPGLPVPPVRSAPPGLPVPPVRSAPPGLPVPPVRSAPPGLPVPPVRSAPPDLPVPPVRLAPPGLPVPPVRLAPPGLPVPPVPPVRLAPLGLPGLPALLARPVPPGLPERSLRRRRWRMRQARRTL